VGIIADPFMGSGSTIAAAEAIGVQAVGVERHAAYYQLARKTIPKLAALRLPVSVVSPIQRMDSSDELSLFSVAQIL
jgi:site-specific DNA-methyltransferase (adenine-specific)